MDKLYCIIDPKSGFKHITRNKQAVRNAVDMGWQVWCDQKRIW